LSDPADLPLNNTDPFSSGADALRVEGLGSAHGSTDASVTARTNGAASVNGAGAMNGSGPAHGVAAIGGAATNGAEVIDLRETGTTRVRVSNNTNPFGALSKQERMRLIVRVLCEIVAYGELEDGDADAAAPQPVVEAPPAATTEEHPITNTW